MTRFNFKGWNWKDWLYGNKELFKVVIPAVLAFCATQNWIDSAIVAIITKPILDILEYYIKE